MVLLVDVTPPLGPAYTLLAFVIVIVGGLGSMAGALLGGVLIGVSEALAGLFIAPSAKSMFSFGLLILVLLFRPQGLLGKRSMTRAAHRARGPGGRCWSRCPAFAGTYVLSVATLILYLAYTGQAWNVMMGFAGQLSLGHSLYVGVGAYAAGGAVLPLRHRPVGRRSGWRSLLCVALGLVIGFLAFRFGISGVYFALLTIAFAEFTRIGFDHLDWLGGPGGLFLQGRAARRLGPAQLPRPAADVLLRDAVSAAALRLSSAACC